MHAIESNTLTYVSVAPMLSLTELGKFEPLLRTFISAFVILDFHFFDTDIYFCHARRVPIAIVGPQNIQLLANKFGTDNACKRMPHKLTDDSLRLENVQGNKIAQQTVTSRRSSTDLVF